MEKALRAGVAYFIIIFALGFILGTFRVLILVQFISEISAVLLETPLMLGASWFICRALIRKFDVIPTMLARLAMGGSAFTLLMIAEQLLGVFVFGRNLEELLFHYQTVAGAIGLGGQVVFGSFSVVQLLVARRH